jgi:hypothetical protein
VAKIPKVTLMVRRKVNGLWKHVKPQVAPNNRLKTLPGDGGFSLRYKLNGEDTWDPQQITQTTRHSPPNVAANHAFRPKRRVSSSMSLHPESRAEKLPIDTAIERYFSNEVSANSELPEWIEDTSYTRALPSTAANPPSGFVLGTARSS